MLVGFVTESTSCRGWQPLCPSGDCESQAAGAGGAANATPEPAASGGERDSVAGAPLTAGSGACGGEGGCSDEPACSRECPLPSQCRRNGDDEECAFDEPVSWIVYAGDDLGGPVSLIARPLEYLDSIGPIDLGADIDHEQSPLFSAAEDDWSPDRRTLIARAFPALDDPRVDLFGAQFGNTLPEPARQLPDVPVHSKVRVEDWSLDSGRALIIKDGSETEGYVVDFAERRTTQVFADAFGADSLQFCDDPRFVTRLYPDGPYIVDLDTGTRHLVDFPELAWVETSPDRRFWLSATDNGIWAAPCGPSGAVLQLAPNGRGPRSWSADGALVSLRGGIAQDEQITVLDADLGFSERTRFQARGTAWAPQSRRLALSRADGNGSSLYLVDLESQTAVERRLSPVAEQANEVRWVTESLLLYAEVDQQDSFQLRVVDVDDPASDHALARLSSDSTLQDIAFDPAGRTAYFVQWRDGLEQAYAVALEAPDALPQALLPEAVYDYVSIVGVAANGSGVLLQRSAPEPALQGSLWWVPRQGAKSAPARQVNTGSYASSAHLTAPR